MTGKAVGDRFPGALLSGMGRTGAPGFAACDTLTAQCLDAMPILIKIVNTMNRIVFYNRAAYQYFGPRIAWARSPPESDELFHLDDRETKRLSKEKVLRRGLAVRVDLRAIRFDYVARWHAFDATPLFDTSQMVTGMLIRMTDIQDQVFSGT